MLNRNDLNKYGPPGFHLSQKEKDYVQHWILYYLSQSGFKGIFKGGTALQKAYNLPRYSEDLDFTLNNSEEPNLESLKAFLESAGFSGISWKKETKNLSSTIKIRFQGPLYSGSEISEGTIVLDFSNREKTLKKTIPQIITPPYPDLLPYSCNVMDKSEMSAEKIRAILSRSSARDLFDLYFLLHQKITIDKKILEQKLSYYELKFNYADFEEKIRKLKKIWKTEIASLTVNFLEYDFVSEFILSELKKFDL